MSDLGTRGAKLERAIAAANEELRSALLRGDDTGSIRERLSSLAAESAEIIAKMGAEQIAAAREIEAQINAAALAVGDAAADRLRARLAALAPPRRCRASDLNSF